jgi:hypothetical protein
MTTPPLSPAAQAVLDAYEDAPIIGGPHGGDALGIAAAIRALVEQTLPDEGDRWREDLRGDAWLQWEQRRNTRAVQLAIAAELDGGAGQPTTQPTETPDEHA